jgi:hypothetical protein
MKSLEDYAEQIRLATASMQDREHGIKPLQKLVEAFKEILNNDDPQKIKW